MSGDFSPEQKRYLEGFTSGLQIARAGRPAGKPAASAPSGPDAEHLLAQDRTVARGGKLNEQEKFKREQHPFDAYSRLQEQAEKNEPPKPADNFRWRYYGLFYVAPAQTSYMCRLRIPNGILTHWQLAGLADLTEQFAGGYSHVTTRANFQIREIVPNNAINVLEGIVGLGLCSRGTGADNIRNVTGTPTAGIDPQELIDTRPYAKAWHHHILNERGLYGLPRKFNVAFDGAGTIPVLEDTNDIGFQAVEVKDGFGAEPGIWFKLALGGITGHRDFARDTGVIVKPADATKVSDAIVRVFSAHGDRTNRNKARMKYVLDAMGFDKYLALVEEKLGSKLTRIPAEALAPRPAFDRTAHIGVHAQKQDGLHWIGVVLPVGKLTCAQMRGLAAIAQQFGDGDIRLTVWQNLLISGVPTAKIADAEAAIEKLGLTTKASSIRSGLVACTGNVGCRFAASDTKRHAEDIARWCEERVELDGPVNIHLTGCHHSCAQHYIGDIGLIACRVSINDDGDTVEGYHILVGGGFGPDAGLAREIYKDVKAEDAPPIVERMLKTYLAQRASPAETFQAFTRRYEIPALTQMFAEIRRMNMNSPARPPLSSIVPESAPFTAEQRVWLNGFFAGLLDGDASALSSQQASALMPGVQIDGAAEEDDGAPWHDQTMPLPDRMKLAEGRPLNRRMMAAMGQQDCGQCGYDCKDYAEALFSKTEERLNLCVPGGKETNRMLKSLYAEVGSAPAAAKPTAPTQSPAAKPEGAPGTSRDNPAVATFVSRTLLNKPGSAKETWHIEFDLTESNLDYTVGDSFGLFPTNDPALVEAVIKALDAPPDFPIGGRTLREVLFDGVALSPAPDMLFQLYSYITGGERRKKAQALAAGEDPDGDAATLDVLAAIQKFPGVRPDPEALIEALDQLQPRLYSISSSPKVHKGRVSLTVDTVRYDIEKRTRLGVASTFLAGRTKPGDKIRVYVQKAHAFGLPADPKVPVIMIGPGTGVAPFRAFLHERMATGAPGKNWLFFGHQKRDFDFFYEDEFSGMKATGVLTRLSLAWSRDGEEKFYVQDRMLQTGRELWSWIADGAHIYVCGDAQRMAKDVERALIDITATHGARSTNEAVHFVAELKKSGRYQTDVY